MPTGFGHVAMPLWVMCQEARVVTYLVGVGTHEASFAMLDNFRECIIVLHDRNDIVGIGLDDHAAVGLPRSTCFMDQRRDILVELLCRNGVGRPCEPVQSGWGRPALCGRVV